MSNILKIKQQQLQDKLGEIVPFDYVHQRKNEHVFIAYLGGTIPVMIKSKLTYEEFCKMC